MVAVAFRGPYGPETGYDPRDKEKLKGKHRTTNLDPVKGFLEMGYALKQQISTPFYRNTTYKTDSPTEAMWISKSQRMTSLSIARPIIKNSSQWLDHGCTLRSTGRSAMRVTFLSRFGVGHHSSKTSPEISQTDGTRFST